jgi:DNA-binding LacI/PurR family transcriptional regulator
MSIEARVTLRDIARRLGVSHATVSLALKNHPNISQRRKEEVQRVAQEMGYRPDPALSSLIAYRRGRKELPIRSSIAWINHLDNPGELRKYKEFEAYWQGATESAERFGYHLDEMIWPKDCSPERFEKIMFTRGIRGVLIPPHAQQPDWGNFHWENFSIIRFGLSVRSPDSHVVTSDQMRMVMMAMEKIHRYGYKRIGFVIPASFDAAVGGTFSGGYLVSQNFLKLSPRLPILSTLPSPIRENPVEALKEFKTWFTKHRPDAIMTAVPEVLDFIKQMGLSIPKDVAVAGTSVSDIPVKAGINQNSLEIGRVAVETLVALINANDRGKPSAPRRILVEGFWQDGDSLPGPKLE